MTIDFELRQQAYELAVIDGVSLDQVAERTGIPRSTITRWSAEDGWMADREEYRKAQGEIRRNLVLYRMKLLRQGMNTLDPQHAYAWATVEAAARKGADGDAPVDSGDPVMEREIRTARDAVDALKDAVERRINRMLTHPGELRLSGIKEMKSALEMVDELERRYGKDEDAARKGLTDDTADEIRRRILGIETR